MSRTLILMRHGKYVQEGDDTETLIGNLSLEGKVQIMLTAHRLLTEREVPNVIQHSTLPRAEESANLAIYAFRMAGHSVTSIPNPDLNELIGDNIGLDQSLAERAARVQKVIGSSRDVPAVMLVTHMDIIRAAIGICLPTNFASAGMTERTASLFSSPPHGSAFVMSTPKTLLSDGIPHKFQLIKALVPPRISLAN